jgi:hypothetical protein
MHGTCYDILLIRTILASIGDAFSDPTTLDPNNWQGKPIDDDVAVSHGDSLLIIRAIILIIVIHSFTGSVVTVAATAMLVSVSARSQATTIPEN